MGDTQLKDTTKKPFSIFKLAIYYFVINFSLRTVLILIFEKSVDPGWLNSFAKAYLLYDINRHLEYSWKKKLLYCVLAWIAVDIASFILIFALKFLLSFIS